MERVPWGWDAGRGEVTGREASPGLRARAAGWRGCDGHMWLWRGVARFDAILKPMTTWTAPCPWTNAHTHFPAAQAPIPSPASSPLPAQGHARPGLCPWTPGPPGKTAAGTGAHLPSAVHTAGSFKQELLQDTALDSRQDPAGTTLQQRARVSAGRKCPGQSRRSCRTSSVHR